MKKRLIVKILCSFLLVSMFLTYETVSFPIVSEAHSGRTDSSGGHHDYKNKSGLGSYHYHCGGYPAHLHPNGVCPYASQGSTSTSGSGGSSSGSNNTAAQEPALLGWQQDAVGWKYYVLADAYYSNGFASVNADTYYFNSDGYILTGWQYIESSWYYFDSNGRMATEWQYITDAWYYFDYSGRMQTGFQKIDGERYYFDANGHMATGSIVVDGTEYYFNSDGTLDDDDEWWDSYEEDEEWDDLYY